MPPQLAAFTNTHAACRAFPTNPNQQLQAYSAMLDKWALYRRQFRSVWDAVSEGLDGKEVRNRMLHWESCVGGAEKQGGGRGVAVRACFTCPSWGGPACSGTALVNHCRFCLTTHEHCTACPCAQQARFEEVGLDSDKMVPAL